MQSVDWDLHGMVIQRTKDLTTILKYIHGMLPVGWLVHKYNPKYSEVCPSCFAPSETAHYFIHCPSSSQSKSRSTILQHFRKTCDAPFTYPSLRGALLHGISATLDKSGELDATQHLQQYHQAITEQNNIGWEHFLKGRWSIQWQLLHQRTHVTPKDSKFLPKQWASSLLNEL